MLTKNILYAYCNQKRELFRKLLGNKDSDEEYVPNRPEPADIVGEVDRLLLFLMMTTHFSLFQFCMSLAYQNILAI